MEGWQDKNYNRCTKPSCFCAIDTQNQHSLTVIINLNAHRKTEIASRAA